MISEAEFFHGALITRLLQGNAGTANIRYMPNESAFLLNERIALLAKYSTSRMSPWSFTLTLAQRISFSTLTEKYRGFLALVCNDDGVACLSAEEVLSLSKNDLNAHAIRVSRPRGGMYKVSGPAGTLPRRIGLNEFPSKVIAELS